MTLVRSVVLVLLLATAGCGRAKSSPSEPATDNGAPHAQPSAEKHHGEPGEPEHDELPKLVKLDAASRSRAGIRSEPAVRAHLGRTLTLSGEIVADPDRTAKISSPVAGRLESVTLREGVVVAKGAVLAELRVPDLGRVRGALAATSARAAATRTNATRLKGLLDAKLTSEQSYLDAKAEADARDAEARALSMELAGLGAGGTEGGVLLPLRAPLAGAIVARDAVVGQPVTTDQVLGQITNLSEVWFLGRVFEQDLAALAVGQKAEVVLNAYPKRPFDGVVEAIGQRVDPSARTVVARVRLANPEGLLRLGLFGKGLVSVADEKAGEPSLVVPRSAIVEIAGRQVVFVDDGTDAFTRHDVTVGAAAPGKVQILSGLREGERVVVNGAFTLKSLVLKGSMAEED